MADRYTEWYRSLTRVKRVIARGLHASDLNRNEMEDELKVAMTDIAAAFGMPRPKWSEEDDDDQI